jgi:hypothetical protein
MMRRTDIEILLDHVDGTMQRIMGTYQESLRAKNIPASLLVDVKNTMENLRSCLDYMAHDVAERVIIPYRKAQGLTGLKDSHFPYGKDKARFNDAVRKNLPDLQAIHPAIYSIIEGIQPHACKNTWLHDFCSVVNANKHDSLSPQERREKQTFQVGRAGGGVAISAPAGAIHAPPGAISIGGVPVIFDPRTGVPLQTPGLEVNVTTWVSFVFKDTKFQVHPLLSIAQHEIRETAKKLYDILE